jgi:hypothetical protein
VTEAGVADAWVREALRVHRRYEVEIVEACGLCPWATRVRTDGKVREFVLMQTDEVMEPSAEAIESLCADDRIEVAFLIYPRLEIGRDEFHAFAARVRDAEAERRGPGNNPFVLAAFHPDAKPDLTDPERLIPFLRRTPDATMQLLRGSVLDRVRSGTPQGTQFFNVGDFDPSTFVAPAPPLRERIARTNLATTERMGVAELTRRLDDIRRDRDESYKTLQLRI